MAKKFRKFLLFTAVAAAGAGAYYYFKNKDKFSEDFIDEDDDDFDDDLDEADSARSYVSLQPDTTKAPAEETVSEEAPFEKLSSLVSDTAKEAAEEVEEFFDEDDETPSEE